MLDQDMLAAIMHDMYWCNEYHSAHKHRQTEEKQFCTGMFVCQGKFLWGHFVIHFFEAGLGFHCSNCKTLTNTVLPVVLCWYVNLTARASKVSLESLCDILFWGWFRFSLQQLPTTPHLHPSGKKKAYQIIRKCKQNKLLGTHNGGKQNARTEKCQSALKPMVT